MLAETSFVPCFHKEAFKLGSWTFVEYEGNNRNSEGDASLGEDVVDTMIFLHVAKENDELAYLGHALFGARIRCGQCREVVDQVLFRDAQFWRVDGWIREFEIMCFPRVVLVFSISSCYAGP